MSRREDNSDGMKDAIQGKHQENLTSSQFIWHVRG